MGACVLMNKFVTILVPYDEHGTAKEWCLVSGSVGEEEV